MMERRQLYTLTCDRCGATATAEPTARGVLVRLAFNAGWTLPDESPRKGPHLCPVCSKVPEGGDAR